MAPRITKRGAGIVGAVVGMAAAGIAAGVAAERYAVRRSKQADDPYAMEPFGELPADQVLTVPASGEVDLRVEVLEGDADAPTDLTVVFVHGFCLDMGTFHFQRTHLTGRYRMVFYDQPGHGRSGHRQTGDYLIEELAQDLAAVIERTAPTGRIVLVGHSMGGMVIMALAESWAPELASRVVGVGLISTSAGQMQQVNFGLPKAVSQVRGPLLPLVRKVGPTAAPVLDWTRRASGDLVWLLTRKYGFGGNRPSPSLVSYVEQMNSDTSLEVISRYLRTIHQHDRLGTLTALRGIPTVLLCGDGDLITPVEHSKAIARALPGSRLFVVSKSGHVALLEHSNAVNRVLDHFLEEVAASGARKAVA